MSKIPVFVSCPTVLSPEQEEQRKIIIKKLKEYNMEPRALGRSDYPKDFPLKEIYVIAKHCAGGIILGFEQMQLETGTSKRGTTEEKKITSPISLPTPWNQIEAGILFGLKLPLLIFKEENISGGIFDYGVTDVFVHNMPKAPLSASANEELKQVFLKWQGAVSSVYYEYQTNS